MNYIVFDLELNSKRYKSEHPNEIIEIGAFKLNEGLEVLDVFQAFVRPKKFRILSPIIKRKTKIKQKDVDDAKGFKEVLGSFKEWVGNDFVLCSWGHDDIFNMRANCRLHKQQAGWLDSNIDIQFLFAKAFQLPMKNRFGLKDAIAMMEIPLDDKLHRAMVDARYTVEIFIKIFDKLDESDVLIKA